MKSINLDNSTLSTEAKCGLQAWLRYGQGRESKEAKHAAEVGNAIHKALEVHLRGGSVDDAMKALNKHLMSIDWAGAQDRLSPANVERLAKAWLTSFPLDSLPYEIYGAPEEPALEIGFQWPLGRTKSGVEVNICGRIDAIVRMNGALYVLDHKSTYRADKHWLGQWDTASQLTGYTWGVQNHLREEVVGCLVNVIEVIELPGGPGRKTDPRCKRHGGKKFSECGDLHIDEHAFLVTQNRTAEQIEEWKKCAMHLAERYIERVVKYKSLKDARKLRSVGTFNGSCDWCGFKDFCKGGKDVSQLEASTVLRPWDPLKVEKP